MNTSQKTNPGDALRDIEHELEGQLADVEAQIAVRMDRATAVESRAMAAIRGGDDALARQEMIAFKTITDAVGELDADRHVLRCLLAEIREFFNTQPSAG